MMANRAAQKGKTSTAKPPEDRSKERPATSKPNPTSKSTSTSSNTTIASNESKSSSNGPAKSVRFEDSTSPPNKDTPVVNKKVDLPFKDVPEVDFVPLERNKRPDHSTITDQDRQGSASKSRAPIDDLEMDELMDRVLAADVTVKLGTLLKSAKGVRETLKKMLTSKRLPPEDHLVSTVAAMTDDQLDYWQDYAQSNEFEGIIDVKDLPQATFMIMDVDEGEQPSASIHISDPVEQYLSQLEKGEKPKQIYVASESESLRVVYPMINGQASEESILDPGSQIVSMSKATAIPLGLSWDPEIVIHMQSANKQIQRSLGLARNVPFRFDSITVYLQVHIINEPAYKVLLGRPFDAITCSTYQNDRDGGQLLTLTCPNTSVKVVMPTHERGKPPEVVRREGFRNSMIWWKTGEK